MKYYLDTEFMEDGRTIDLLSIGLVAEDGRELYAVSNEADHSHANEFVRDAVIPHLFDDVRIPDQKRYAFLNAPRWIIRDRVLNFIKPDPDQPKPEIWGYYADYDWVVFCQLFGTMMDLPKGMPMYCRDIKQAADEMGGIKLPPKDNRFSDHHALVDARWTQRAHNFLLTETLNKNTACRCIYPLAGDDIKTCVRCEGRLA